MQVFAFDKASKALVYGPEIVRAAPAQYLANIQAMYPNAAIYVHEGEEVALPVEAVWNGAEVTGVQHATQSSLWLHITTSGGDNQDPLGIANSGDQWRVATISYALRQGPEGTDPLVPVDNAFRMRLRDARTRAVVYVKRAELAGGQGTVEFRVPDNAPCGELVLDEADFVPVGGHMIRLAGEFRLVVFMP